VTPELESFLERLLRDGRQHDAALSDRRERLRNVEPETARLLAVLVLATSAKRVLELGTSNGYSTLWLADAVASTGGRVTTVENDEGRAAMAAENFARAGLASVIELRVEDAGTVLTASPHDAWDLVFLDAERDRYVAYWPEVVRCTGRPGLIAVDNVLSHADELVEFTGLVAQDPSVTSALVPVGAGVLLATKS
jgi:predicted O-methyltransferase YrrM